MPHRELKNALEKVGLRASVFYLGGLCGDHPFTDNAHGGHLHVVTEGSFELIDRQGHKERCDTPALILYRSYSPHHLNIPKGEEAQVVCAHITYAQETNNIVTEGLPELVHIALTDLPLIQNILDVLQKTRELSPLIRGPIQNKLCEVMLLHVIGHLLEQEAIHPSVLRGLADPTLGPLVSKILDAPGEQWDVDNMANSLAMSKTKFTQQFLACVGETPGQFLRSRRINQAKALLCQHKHLDLVAHRCGYASQASFSRAFKQQTGEYPSQWRKKMG